MIGNNSIVSAIRTTYSTSDQTFDIQFMISFLWQMLRKSTCRWHIPIYYRQLGIVYFVKIQEVSTSPRFSPKDLHKLRILYEMMWMGIVQHQATSSPTSKSNINECGKRQHAVQWCMPHKQHKLHMYSHIFCMAFVF